VQTTTRRKDPTVHTATQLYHDDFQVDIDGMPAILDDFLPGWNVSDRFGIVIDEPFGGLGASLLIQLAIVNFFDVKPERRLRDTAEYPEIYVFHFGGVFGDHSNYDFWPPRKEVMIDNRDPISLLEALNGCAITRLALPHGPLGDRERLRCGASTWAEEHSAVGRIESALAYTTDGVTPEADVVLRSSCARVEENVVATLDTLRAARDFVELPADAFSAALPGPSVPDDVYRWRDIVEARINEVDQARKDELTAMRLAMFENTGASTETYRRLTVDQALRRIAAME
jgi:hypothetical protein